METALQPFACNKMETRLLYSGRLRAAFQKYDLYMTTKNRDVCLYEWGTSGLMMRSSVIKRNKGHRENPLIIRYFLFIYYR